MPFKDSRNHSLLLGGLADEAKIVTRKLMGFPLSFAWCNQKVDRSANVSNAQRQLNMCLDND